MSFLSKQPRLVPAMGSGVRDLAQTAAPGLSAMDIEPRYFTSLDLSVFEMERKM